MTRQRKRPLRLDRVNVVGVMESPNAIRLARRLASDGIDVLELRLDAFHDAPDPNLVAALPLPVIATVRSPKEGGKNGLSDRERISRFSAFTAFVQAVDVELASREKLLPVIEAAHAAGKRVILSFHDFEGTPSLKSLLAMQRKAAQSGADVFKVAVTPRSPAELGALLTLLDSPPIPTALMGMGRYGKVSRLMAAACGSVLNYGWIERPNVRGQWSVTELRVRLNELRKGAA